MPLLGALTATLLGLLDCLWHASSPAEWAGLGRALLVIALLHAAAGATLGALFSLVWRRIRASRRRWRPAAEAAVFAILMAGGLAAVEVNRALPEGILALRSLVADALLAAAGAAALATILVLSGRAARAARPRVGRRALAVGGAAGLVILLSGIGLRARAEKDKASPLAAVSVLSTSDAWTVAPPARRDPPPPAPRLAGAPRLVVLGMDGATWDIMGPMMERGRLPNLRSLLAGGVGGVLRSDPGAFSPIVWTTIFTGKVPARHGLDRPETANAANRKVRALWNILSERRQRLLVANVPGTYPVEPIRGAMLAGFPNEGETGNNLGYLFTTRRASDFDDETGIRIERIDPARLEGPGGDRIRIRDKSPLPHRTALLAALGLVTGATSSPLDGWLAKSYATLSVRRSDGGLRFDLAGCAGCGFVLAHDWSPWIVIRREPRPLAFRLRVVESSEEAVTIYATPLFLLDWSSQVSPPELGERLGRGRGPYLVEGSGWLYFREPRLLQTLSEHLFGVARDRMQDVTALWRQMPFDGLIFVFTLIDRTQHSFWSFLDPASFPRIGSPDPYPVPFPAGFDPAGCARVIPEAYESADRQIGRLLGEKDPRTLVMVLSDHGFRSGASRIPGSGVHDPAGIYIFSGAGLPRAHEGPASLAADGPVLRLVDILPTALALLRLPVAADFDGTPASFAAEALLARGETIATIDSYESETGDLSHEPALIDDETIEQLRSLGYVQ